MLRCSGHGGGEVAAARSFGGGVAKGGSSSARGMWFQGLVEVPREAEAKLELACGRPRAAGGRRTALAAGNRGADRRKKKRTGSQIQKISGTQM